MTPQPMQETFYWFVHKYMAFFDCTPEKARYPWARVTQRLHGNFLLFLALFRLTHRRAISFLRLSGDCIISFGEEHSQDNNANSEAQYLKKTWLPTHHLYNFSLSETDKWLILSTQSTLKRFLYLTLVLKILMKLCLGNGLLKWSSEFSGL